MGVVRHLNLHRLSRKRSTGAVGEGGGVVVSASGGGRSGAELRRVGVVPRVCGGNNPLPPVRPVGASVGVLVLTAWA